MQTRDVWAKTARAATGEQKRGEKDEGGGREGGGEEQYETSVSVIMGVENGPKSRKNKQKTKNKIKTNENV